MFLDLTSVRDPLAGPLIPEYPLLGVRAEDVLSACGLLRQPKLIIGEEEESAIFGL
jgi:hypothetical protein